MVSGEGAIKVNIQDITYAILTNIGYLCRTGWSFTDDAESVLTFRDVDTAIEERDSLWHRYTNFGDNEECTFDGRVITFMEVVEIKMSIEVMSSEIDRGILRDG